MAEEMSSLTEKRVEALEKDISDTKSAVRENRDLLVGTGGNIGVCGNIELLKVQVESMNTLLTNDLKHIAARIDIMFASRDLLMNAKEAAQEVKNDGNVTSKEVLKEWVKPIVTAVITAILLYFIITSGLAK